MARKKKSKKKAKPKASSVASGPSDSASEEEVSASDGETPSSKKKSPPKKKAGPKKKRTRKKAAKKDSGGDGDAAKPAPRSGKKRAKKSSKKEAEGDQPASAPEPEAQEAEDLDADVGDTEEVEKLLQDVTDIADTADTDAVLDADAAGPEPSPDPDETAEIEDLDAIIEDDLDDSEDLDALIAATVAGAAPEDQVEDVPVEALDEEKSVEVVDIESDGPQTPAYSEAGDVAAGAASDVEAAAMDASAAEPAPSSEEELAGAIDLGDVSTPELRDRLLAQALAHAEMRDALYRVPFSDPGRAGRWKAGLATILFLVAGFLAVAPPGWVRPDPPARIDAEARTTSIRRALLLQAQQVDAYRVRSQRLPRSLEDLPGRLDGIRYVRSGNRAFQLIAYTPDGRTVVYDSSNPAPEFESLGRGWPVGAAQ